MKRGVIALPGLIKPLPKGFNMERSISEEEMAFYILYWDEVVIPDNNLVSIGVPLQEEYIASGAISRPRVVYGGNYEGDMVTNAVLGVTAVVAAEKSKSVDEDWVLHQYGGTHALPSDISKDRDALRLVLSSVLPTPGKDVPLVEILEFKERFRSSRNALHECLDETYQDVLNAPDMQLHARKSIARLRDEINGIGAIDKRTSGWSKFNLTVEFNLTADKIKALATGVGLDFMSGAVVPVATLATAAASFIEIGAGTSKTVGESKTDRLGYLTAARKDGIFR